MNEFFIIAGAHLLAVMSPGPDFIMVTTRTLQSGKKAGCMVAIGLGIGIFFHSIFALVGLGYIIEHSIIAFSIIKIIGALYLLWMSWHLIRARKNTGSELEIKNQHHVQKSLWQDIKTGWLTNVLNPKASLFFLALFSQIVSPETNIVIKSLYASEMIGMTILWFSIVAWMIDKNAVKRVYLASKHWIDRTMGVVLGYLGLRLLFVTKE